MRTCTRHLPNHCVRDAVRPLVCAEHGLRPARAETAGQSQTSDSHIQSAGCLTDNGKIMSYLKSGKRDISSSVSPQRSGHAALLTVMSVSKRKLQVEQT